MTCYRVNWVVSDDELSHMRQWLEEIVRKRMSSEQLLTADRIAEMGAAGTRNLRSRRNTVFVSSSVGGEEIVLTRAHQLVRGDSSWRSSGFPPGS